MLYSLRFVFFSRTRYECTSTSISKHLDILVSIRVNLSQLEKFNQDCRLDIIQGTDLDATEAVSLTEGSGLCV